MLSNARPILPPADYKAACASLVANADDAEFEKKLDTFFRVARYTGAREAETNPIESLTELLNDNFLLGESHSDVSSKNFLITNMQRLKAEGFTTLFMEHLFYDDQEALDNYCFGDGSASEIIEARLRDLDRGFCPWNMDKRTRWLANNFSALVKAAKDAGIRIVGLDTHYTYSEQMSPQHMEYYGSLPTGCTLDDYRIRSMNFTACKIILVEAKKLPGKWFSLMGLAHAKKTKAVEGVSDITGARVLCILDGSADEARIAFNESMPVSFSQTLLNPVADKPELIRFEVAIINDFTVNAPELHSNSQAAGIMRRP